MDRRWRSAFVCLAVQWDSRLQSESSLEWSNGETDQVFGKKAQDSSVCSSIENPQRTSHLTEAQKRIVSNIYLGIKPEYNPNEATASDSDDEDVASTIDAADDATDDDSLSEINPKGQKKNGKFKKGFKKKKTTQDEEESVGEEEACF